MKNINLLILIIFSFVSCKKDKQTNVLNPEILINNCSNTIELPTDGSFTICYDSLISDSRCPIDAVCIWEGFAQVKLSLHIDNTVIHFKLATMHHSALNLINDTTINGINIKLEDVSPYPSWSSPYNINDSKVKLKLSY